MDDLDHGSSRYIVLMFPPGGLLYLHIGTFVHIDSQINIYRTLTKPQVESDIWVLVCVYLIRRTPLTVIYYIQQRGGAAT